MKLRFESTALVGITESFDEETETAETHVETFQEGEVVDVDVLNEPNEAEYYYVQFGDGSVATILKSFVSEVPEDEAAANIVVGNPAMLADALAGTMALNDEDNVIVYCEGSAIICPRE